MTPDEQVKVLEQITDLGGSASCDGRTRRRAMKGSTVPWSDSLKVPATPDRRTRIRRQPQYGEALAELH